MMFSVAPVGFRSLKVASVLKRALAQLFMRELSDLSATVSISGVKVSDDARNATVFVVVMGEPEARNDTINALNDASGGIRRSIFKYLKLRYVPRLYFRLDAEYDNFLRVSEIMVSLE
ncbi:MAG: 30S ribosome-binding factor RbfA [Anaplasma sp.]